MLEVWHSFTLLGSFVLCFCVEACFAMLAFAEIAFLGLFNLPRFFNSATNFALAGSSGGGLLAYFLRFTALKL